MSLSPTYTFEVVAYDRATVLSSGTPANDMDNTILQLESRIIWFEGISEGKRHGDQFTVSGHKAFYLKRRYVGTSNPLLKIVS